MIKKKCVNCGKVIELPDHALDPIPRDSEHDEEEETPKNFVCSMKCGKEQVDKFLEEDDEDD